MKINNLFIVATFLIIVQNALAQEVKVTVSVKKIIETGETFRLSFTVNANADNFKAPALNNFDVIAGPSVSTQSSFQFINGKATNSVSTIYSYYLRANKPGTFTIGKASVTVNGKQHSSAPTEVEVMGQNKASNPTEANTSNANINTSQDFFLRISLSKTKPYQGEQILATTKIYYSEKMGFGGLNSQKQAKFEGFWKKDLDMPNRLDFKRENINGKTYLSAVLAESIISPQRAGEFTIDPAEINATIGVGFQGRDLWGRERYQQVFDKTIKSNAPKIQVTPIPTAARPKSFTGAVGQYTLEADVSANELVANDALTVQLKIRGTGDIRLVEAPVINFPPVFEKYDPKPKHNVRDTRSGTQGVVVFEYLVIAREQGQYTLEPVVFSYFDPELKKFVELKTDPFNILVKKGDGENTYNGGTFVDKEDVQIYNSDILHINETNLSVQKKGSFFFASILYYLTLLAFLLIFSLFFIIKRKQIKLNSNTALAKNKKANQMIQKRLKKAKALMQTNDSTSFFAEILNALWKYLSDKLAIPTSELDKENISKKLAALNIKPTIASAFIELIDKCEFARYAPSATSENMQQILDTTAKIIRQLEQSLKNK